MLGSQSPRRRQLLTDLGFEFEVIVRETPEQIPEGLSPKEVVAHIAKEKAAAFDDLAESHIVVTADTIVVWRDKIMGKPTSRDHAKEMLLELSGGEHEVMTAVCVRQGETCNVWVESTQVFFRELSEAEIDFYIEKYRPFDKAGAYGVQEWIGMVGMTRLNGDYYNVMGLPVHRVWEMLRGFIVVD